MRITDRGWCVLAVLMFVVWLIATATLPPY